MPLVCLQFVIVVFPDHTHLLFFITINEKWIHHFKPEAKQKSKQWNHPGNTNQGREMLFHDMERKIVPDFMDADGILV